MDDGKFKYKVSVAVIIILSVLFAGCKQGDKANENSKKVPAEPFARDPQAVLRIIEKFFHDNPSDRVRVLILAFGDQLTPISTSEEVDKQMIKAVKEESHALPLGKNCGPWGRFATCWLILEGSDYALIIWLDELGFGMGAHSPYRHRLTNPRLAAILKDVFSAEGMLKGPLGHQIRVRLKKGAGHLDPGAAED